MYYILLMRRHWLFLLLGTLIPTAAMGYYMYNYQPNWYAATVTFVPPQMKSTGLGGMLGGITSALQDFGLSKVGGGGGAGYTHGVILRSRMLKDSLIEYYNLDSAYELQDATPGDVRKALDNNFDVTFEKLGNYALTIYDKDPETAARMANHAVKIGDNLASELFRTEASVQRGQMEKQMRQNQLNLQIAMDSIRWYANKYQLIEPEVQAAAAIEGLAQLRTEQFRQQTALELMRQYLGDNDPAVRTQEVLVENLRNQVANAQSEPGFVGNFSLDKGADVMLRYLTHRADAEAYGRMKAIMIPMYEQTILDEQRNMPSMYILDEALPPDRPARPMRSLFVAGTALMMLTILGIFVAILEKYRALKRDYPDYFGDKKKSLPRSTDS